MKHTEFEERDGGCSHFVGNKFKDLNVRNMNSNIYNKVVKPL